VKLLLDTSVWVEHLRHGALDELLGPIRGSFSLCMDVVAASELRAGCRSKQERRVVARLCAPHERANRLLCPTQRDFERAALALSELRERGRSPSGSKAALLDALIASLAAREGALLVTQNVSDFATLALVIPAHVESFDSFRKRMLARS
jgi:predicted nucleic acid-binding protein